MWFCFEGASHMVAQLWFVWCGHTFIWVLDSWPPALSTILQDFSSVSFEENSLFPQLVQHKLWRIQAWASVYQLTRPWLLLKTQKTSSTSSYSTFQFAERFIKCSITVINTWQINTWFFTVLWFKINNLDYATAYWNYTLSQLQMLACEPKWHLNMISKA